MASRFWGDGHYVLPTSSIEPYRLWFEWLKLAELDRELVGDPDHQIQFTGNHYADWGDVQNVPFAQWWEENWRDLFGMTAGVIEIRPGQIVPQGDGFITLFVPLTGRRDKIAYQVDQIVAQHPAFEETEIRPTARYELTAGYDQGFTKRLTESRRYLQFYKFWLEQQTENENDRVDLAFRAFVDWHRNNNDEAIRLVGSLKEPYKVYDRFLADRHLGARVNRAEYSISHRRDGKQLTAERSRKAIGRDLAKARKIAQNVAKGQFPGDYSSV
jgi:hypothetical protein